MLLYKFRRWRKRPEVRITSYILIALAIFDLLSAFFAYSTFSQNLSSNTLTRRQDLPLKLRKQKIFICAQFWTSADIISEFWESSLLDLIDALGAANIYVSILGSGSLDNTDEWVRYLDGKLGELRVERTIVLDQKTHKDEIEGDPYDKSGAIHNGWIMTGESEYKEPQLRRIPYLAKVRNDVLAPLLRMHRNHGRTFDKILFLNDVTFTRSDILTLLATNDGSYDVACSLDFHLPPDFYDTFAARDTDGVGPVMSQFPYFRSGKSRKAMLQGNPTPVTSCWNGIVMADTKPYYPHLAVGTEGSDAKLMNGLQFRGVPDSLAAYHLEASECCLIHADLIASGEAQKGLFINPAVRVGYTQEAYDRTHLSPDGGFVSFLQYFRGIWVNRILRWKRDGVNSSAGQHMKEVYKRIRNWKHEGEKEGRRRTEVGDYCTIDEMHILIWNGWKHV